MQKMKGEGMQNKEYTLGHFKAGDFKDQNGNTWADASFEGVSEPVKWVVKDVDKIKVGESYYGHFTDETTKNGKPYRRFRREKRPDAPQGTQGSQQSNKPDEAYWADKQAQIRAQWAIGQAVKLFSEADNWDWDRDNDLVEKYAKHLYALVDRVKGGATIATVNEGDKIFVQPAPSGYDKAKAVAAKLKQDTDDVPLELRDQQIAEDDADIVTGGPIDIDDIPF